MELKKILYPLRRWWWLLVIATLVAAMSSFVATLRQPKIYQASTTLMIGRAIEDPNPSSSEFGLGQQLAATYADIANRELVSKATMDALGWKWLPKYFAQAVPNSQIIEITVVDTVPERAQLVANTLAEQLIQISPTGGKLDEKNRQDFVNQQLDTLEVQIQQTQAEIDKLQSELGNLVSARQINDTQNQIVALQAKYTTLQGNYASLLSNTQRGAVNSLSVIEPAGLPTRPVGPSRAVLILVAGMIGFVLAGGTAYLLEYLDDTLKTPEDVERVIGQPIIGYVREIDGDEKNQPFVENHPRHPFTEAFRAIRTNLEFFSVDQPLKTILVTSTDAEEGKTSVVANLAVIMSQADKRVVAIDADLRRPTLHGFMGIPNNTGLSDIFRGRLEIQRAMHFGRNEKVAVIPAGTQPPNPSELLGSKKMDQIFTILGKVADMVIIDGPPFIVTDAVVLAAKVDGVIIVVRPGYTREAATKAMVEQINRSGAKIVGVVVYRIPGKFAGYYRGQLYISPYYSAESYFEEEKPVARGAKGQLPASR